MDRYFEGKKINSLYDDSNRTKHQQDIRMAVIETNKTGKKFYLKSGKQKKCYYQDSSLSRFFMFMVFVNIKRKYKGGHIKVLSSVYRNGIIYMGRHFFNIELFNTVT